MLHYSDIKTVSAAGLVVTVEDARRNLDLDDTYRDADLRMWIEEATAQVEHDARTALLTQTRQCKLHTFPSGEYIELLAVAPVLAVSSISYLDSAGASQTLSTSVYSVDVARKPAVVWLKYGQSWPTVYSQPNSVTITYTAGYGTAASSVPAAARSAVLIYVRHRFERPELVASQSLKEIDAGYAAQIRQLSWGMYP